MAERKRTDPNWHDLQVLLTLGRHGSLSAAARTLGVNHATIARRVRSLETSIGRKLVDRRPEGYVLTTVGTHVLAAAGDMEAAAQTIGRGASDAAPRGLVRVNAPPALAQGFLIARLAELAAKEAGLDIDLASDMAPVSLERHEADIAIRMLRPKDSDLIAKPLVAIGYGFYGLPAVCRRVESGAEPVFVGFDEADSYVPEAAWLLRQHPRARVAFRVGNQFAQATAALSGAGLALVPHYIGRKCTGLRLCKLEPVPQPRNVWLLTRRRDRTGLPIRTTVDHIVRAFQNERALFV